MEYLIGLFIIGAYALGLHQKGKEMQSLRDENAQLRSFLYTSRGYTVKPTRTPVEATETEKKPHLNMDMPTMGKHQTTPPDLYKQQRLAMLEDAEAVKEGKKPAMVNEL